MQWLFNFTCSTSWPCHAQQDVSFSINYNILLSHNWWPLISLTHPEHLHDQIQVLHVCCVLLISAPFMHCVHHHSVRVLHFSTVHYLPAGIHLNLTTILSGLFHHLFCTTQVDLSYSNCIPKYIPASWAMKSLMHVSSTVIWPAGGSCMHTHAHFMYWGRHITIRTWDPALNLYPVVYLCILLACDQGFPRQERLS